MPDRPSRTDDAQWYGAQEAARLLGVHRSTLNIAVRQGFIVPDSFTPGGHTRFRRDTLEAFRVRLTDSAATSREGVVAPARVLAEVAHLLTAPREVEHVAEALVDGICRALPGVAMCCVSVRTGDPADRLQVRTLAQRGFPQRIFSEYSRYRSTFRFATTAALQTREPQICGDVSSGMVFSGTAQLFRSLQLGAYVVQPILWGDEALGIIACVYPHPHPFGDSERTFLRGVADELATALRRTSQVQQLSANLSHARVLMRHALLSRAARAPSCSAEQAAEAAGLDMGEVFRRVTGARAVCALGFDVDLPTNNARLLELACRACAGDEAVYEEWSEKGTLHTGIGASVSLHPSQRAGVAAIWHGVRATPEADDALLVTFAGAYVVAVGVQ